MQCKRHAVAKLEIALALWPSRLRALLYENLHEVQKAHTAWQEFEKVVANNPAAWSG